MALRRVGVPGAGEVHLGGVTLPLLLRMVVGSVLTVKTGSGGELQKPRCREAACDEAACDDSCAVDLLPGGVAARLEA